MSYVLRNSCNNYFKMKNKCWEKIINIIWPWKYSVAFHILELGQLLSALQALISSPLTCNDHSRFCSVVGVFPIAIVNDRFRYFSNSTYLSWCRGHPWWQPLDCSMLPIEVLVFCKFSFSRIAVPWHALASHRHQMPYLHLCLSLYHPKIPNLLNCSPTPDYVQLKDYSLESWSKSVSPTTIKSSNRIDRNEFTFYLKLKLQLLNFATNNVEKLHTIIF